LGNGIKDTLRKWLPGPVKTVIKSGYYGPIDTFVWLEGLGDGPTEWIPEALKPALRAAWYLPVDIAAKLEGIDPRVPPERMIFTGRGNYTRIGQEFLKYFVELGHLEPHHRVLDVGSGLGRMALPLTDYLTEEGEYWGVEIVRLGVNWCRRRITSQHPNFHFVHSNVRNVHYNPAGDVLPHEYRFPFEDDSFDFVFLTSVFTHMLPRDLERYLSEVARVLKPGARCLITCFLLNAESRALVAEGRGLPPLRYALDDCMVQSADDPEEAIAHDEVRIRGLFERYGLSIESPIHYGSWCEREDFFGYQDIVVAQKTEART
jgi:SAM-dependent methyltransferase